ncbi:hypothetical protein BD410DRAFT_807754 [Rickenella mellea]|uniref:BTB domain-containing protein n=1 Tax=Rickenella mellea TaxID=50990 RepID=A0A4Y7PPA1_9AGAM|nr:hypothetical protein BD410DRAFT_807754 [Rickenella mellea]
MMRMDLNIQQSTPTISTTSWTPPNDSCVHSEEMDVHPIYYFRQLVFLVDRRLFKVPRIFFEGQSTVFDGMFMLPLGGADHMSCEEGTADSNPIRLDGVSKDEFASFLKFLIPLNLLDTVHFEKSECIGALSLATMWDFPRVRVAAIAKLEGYKLSIVEKLVLGHKYDVNAWILPAYVILAKRISPPTIEEAKELGLEATVKMFQARERVIKARENACGFRAGRHYQSTHGRILPPPQLDDGEHDEDVNYTGILTDLFGKNILSFDSP